MMSKKVMHPIMVANNKKLACPYYFFGKCLKRGGGLPASQK